MRSIVFIAAMLIMSSASAQITVIDERPALDPGDKQLFTEALNRAMVRETGSVSEWSDPASKTTAKCWRVETTPCRSFDHTVFVGEQVWSYNGIACRAADGTWQEVGSRSNGQFVASVESKETSSRPTSSPKARSSASSGATEVHLVREAGTFRVPVLINGVIELNFTLDSGASDVLIPADVVMTLLRTGTLKESDFLGTKTYVLADGSTVPSATFRIRMLKVGDRTIENVIGAVADVTGSLLLGQSFLSKFNSWSVDNSRQVLVLD